jgi:hypothetical protein
MPINNNTINIDSAQFRALFQGDPILEYGKSKKFMIIKKNVSIYDDSDNELISEVFPNPTNNKTNIKFNLDKTLPVSIDLIDISGAVVKNLFNNLIMQSGEQTIELNLNNIPTGKYFIQIKIEGHNVLRDIIIEK